jgi:flagellar basal body-associated protein FliL
MKDDIDNSMTPHRKDSILWVFLGIALILLIAGVVAFGICMMVVSV